METNGMQQTMDKTAILQNIRRLNVTERLNIITDIWDDIKDSHEMAAVSDEEKKLLLDRLAHYRANPETATDWEDLKQEVYLRHVQQG